jgi:branched-chain amino acid transport system substrate-binding protein
MTNRILTYTAATLMALGGVAQAQQGVSDDSITIGMHVDLSGPLAIWGAPSTNGVRMRFDEANANGGVHGRMINVVVEDTKYEVPLAARATNKLVNSDKIFAMLNGTGTSQTLASMKILDPKGIPNLFPLTGAASMTEPFNKLHFSQFVSYKNQSAAGVRHFASEGATKLCLQSVANDFGAAMDEGARVAAEDLGMEIVYEGAHKVTEADFAGVATAIKNTDCEVLMMGTTIRDTIALYAALRQLGWDKPVFGSMVPYTPIVAQAGGGKLTEGLYLSSSILAADFASDDPVVQAFVADYKEKFGEEPTLQAQMGYVAADLAVTGLENAGRDLTVDSLIAGIQQITEYKDLFGGPSLSFGPDKHEGGDGLVLLQNQGGEWVKLKDGLSY